MHLCADCTHQYPIHNPNLPSRRDKHNQLQHHSKPYLCLNNYIHADTGTPNFHLHMLSKKKSCWRNVNTPLKILTFDRIWTACWASGVHSRCLMGKSDVTFLFVLFIILGESSPFSGSVVSATLGKMGSTVRPHWLLFSYNLGGDKSNR